MKSAFVGIFSGIFTGLSLSNNKELTMTALSLSVLTELLMILITNLPTFI